MDVAPRTLTAFDGHRRLIAGSLAEVALALKHASDAGAAEPLLVYDDATGRLTDLDLRGSDAEILARHSASEAPAPTTRGRGRPKLGVVAREVTLLPRHWEWLNAQPGGASVALRKLVEGARRENGARDRTRRTQEAAYHFMSSMAGDFPNFEEAARSLFAGDEPRFRRLVANWPADVAAYAIAHAFPSEGETA